jgi:sarcosine oxidase, subunit delta
VLLIPCPWCGTRAEDEFVYGGDASIERPRGSDSVSDAEWLGYLYLRRNPKGQHVEWWFHQHGCGSWFRVLRNTVDHRIAVARQGGQIAEDAES